MGLDTFSGIIPLGFDYSCKNKECLHKFRSFTSEGQVDQTTTFFKFVDKTNFDNDPDNDKDANTEN